MKENGIVPLGHGGQAWQEATIFDAVVLSLGTDFYQQGDDRPRFRKRSAPTP